jgi:hypothetical protein
MTLIEWTEHFCWGARGRLEIAARTGLVTPGQIRGPRGEECLDGVSYLSSNQQEGLKVTKTTRAILAGAAFAGLFTGTNAAVKASTLLPSLKTSLSTQDYPNQDQNQGQKSEKAKDKKDRHACKGQNSCKGKGGCKEGDNGCKGKNSCKGKGGCRTDGKKKPS